MKTEKSDYEESVSQEGDLESNEDDSSYSGKSS